MKQIDQVPSMRVSEAEKYKDNKKWAKDIIDYYSPHSFNSGLDVESNDIENYNLYNNTIDPEELKKFCDPLELEIQANQELYSYNKIPNKVNILLGELIKRNNYYYCLVLDNASIIKKDYELAQKKDELIANEIAIAMEEISLLIQGYSEEEAQQMIMELKTSKIEPRSFMSELEVFGNSVLKYARNIIGTKDIEVEGFKHAIITDTEVHFVGVKNGIPTIECVNKINFFYHKSPEVKYFQDGDVAGTCTPMSVTRMLQIYGDKLTEEQLESYDYTSPDKRDLPAPDIHYNNKKTVQDVFMESYSRHKDVTSRQGSYGTGQNRWRIDENVYVTHMEWKAFRRIAFVTYVNEWGEEISEIHDDGFKVPKDAVKINITNKFLNETHVYRWEEEGILFQLEYMWIPRIWEGTRIGSDIYVDVREKPYQSISIENPYDCAKLSYHGVVYTNTNSKSISLVSRMKPLQYVFFVAFRQLVKLISRNYGVIPNIDTTMIDRNLSPTQDPEEALKLTMWYITQGFNVYNSLKDSETESLAVVSRPSLTPINLSNTQDITNLSQFLVWLDREIGLAAGISPEREANFQQNTNVTDNQQAILQSYNITEILFWKHFQLWAEINKTFLSVFRRWAKKKMEIQGLNEISLQYLLEDNTRAVLKVLPEYLDEGDIGVYTSTSALTEEYFQKMEELSLSYVQNNQASILDISNILKARINGTSPEEVHSMLERLVKEREKATSEMQQRQMQLQEQSLRMQREKEDLDRQNKIDMIQAKGEEDRKTLAFQLGITPSEEVEPEEDNSVEIMKIRSQEKMQEKELKQRDKELEISAKLKEEEIKVKRIAANKPRASK